MAVTGQVAHGVLSCEFSSDGLVLQGRAVRGIARFIDLTDVRPHPAPYHSSRGRPWIEPELTIRMLLTGYCQGIRAARRRCEEVHGMLADRWYCRLGLADPAANHSTLSQGRHGRFRENGLFRPLLEKVLQRCTDEALRWSRLGADADLIPHCPAEHCAAMSREGRMPIRRAGSIARKACHQG